MRTQLQGIESILKVVWTVNCQNKFITILHSCIIFVIFLDIRLEASSFTKNEPLNRYFSSILSAISPGNCKNCYFKEHIFFPKHFQQLHFLLFLQHDTKNNKRTYKTGNSLFLTWLMSLFAHIFTTRNFKKIRDQIKHIVLQQTYPKF